MPTFTLETEQFVPRPLAEVFSFFADALNLQRLTPPWLHFDVLTPAPIEMKAGALIDYKLRVHGLPIRWRTRINEWQPPHRFVDEQIRGPYRLWRHQHTFEQREGGTVMRDRVEYAVIGGRWVNALFVRPDLRRIFRYRAAAMREIFGGAGEVKMTFA